jgi:hypothetical protein
MNQVALVGNLTDDPKLRYTQSGAGLAGFTVAVSDSEEAHRAVAGLLGTAWDSVTGKFLSGRDWIGSHSRVDDSRDLVVDSVRRRIRDEIGDAAPDPDFGSFIPTEIPQKRAEVKRDGPNRDK